MGRAGAAAPARSIFGSRLSQVIEMRARLLLAAMLSLPALPPAQAAETFEIPVIATLTGGGAFVGAYMKQNLGAFESLANKQGGIRGRPIHFIFQDDQSTPQVAVQLAGEIMSRDRKSVV